jgi:hypothetical protein
MRESHSTEKANTSVSLACQLAQQSTAQFDVFHHIKVTKGMLQQKNSSACQPAIKKNKTQIWLFVIFP